MSVHPACIGCPLRGKKEVRPEGSLNAEMVFVGEAPGEEEEKQGRPFVGHSGRILRAVLDVLGVDGKVYITNVVKCHPPKNQLSKEVVRCCKVLLEQELLRLGKRKLIVALGATAKEFFGIPGSMSNVRGKFFDTKYGKVLVTWHPAYRNLLHKDPVRNISPYEQFVKDLARGSIYVEQGRMYKPIEFEIVEGGGLEKVLSVIGGKSVAVDFETAGKDVWAGGFRPMTVALSVCDKTFVVDLEKLKEEREKEFMREVFERAERVVVYNAGFDVVIGVSRYGWELYRRAERIEDVQVMNYLLSGKAVPDISLKDLVLDYLDVGQYGIDWKKTKIEELPRGKLYEYNALDAYCTLKLFELFKERLKKAPLRWNLIFGGTSKSLFDVYEEVLKKIVCLCVELEVNGLYADVDYLVQLKKDLERKRLEFLRSVSGINLNSPKQVLRWLSDVGVVLDSTRKEVLEGFLKENEGKISESAKARVELLLEYRVIEKMLGTYVEPFLEKWIRNDGCIHSKFSIIATDTGRLASYEPNLMNIPTKLGPILEKAFVSRFGDEGNMIKADFSQHELRVACQYSKDFRMKEFFESGVDIHTKVAVELYNMPLDSPDDIKKAYRRKAKGFNFGIIYGRGARSVAQELGISEKEAKETIERYFQMFPGLKAWLDSVKEFVRKFSYVRSMFGRFRWIDPDEDKEGWAQKAVNTPIQSAASDIAALTAYRIVQRMYKEGLRAKMVNFVHDSMIIDCPCVEVEEVCRLIKEEVQRIELPEERFLNFEIDIAVGKSWGECKE